ncbi:S41 family peptidase [Puteibacter caeruleilacunae]|nr:S41 family peptidase [Puteibacter caeruleilacunae]
MNGKLKPYYTPIIIALAVTLGFVLGNNMKQNASLNLDSQRLFSMGKMSTILSLISSEYVDSVSVSELEEKAIPELLKNLDPHTVYIPAKKMRDVTEEMSGNFGGIGVQFSIQNDTVMVIDVVTGGPSQKLGILAGDRIVEVDDTLIAGIGVKNERVMNLLRGEIGTDVNVGIARKGYKELIDFKITRGEIPLISVDVSYMMDDKTGFIKVSRFSEKTYEEFYEALYKLKEQSADQLIVDLRGNTGGSLGAVIRMVNEFLDEGDLILKTKGNSRPEKSLKADSKGIWKEGKVMVLIDEFSASASEIFAGALQDNDRGVIVGRRSFGKGLVQEQIPLMDGSALRLTVARYYTPSGRSIQKPYDLGHNDDYFKDISNRYVHGEFLEKDSIEMKDTLRYYTKSGRVVFGGGGIMPDHFVPVDTTGYSDYFYKVTQKGLIYQFAFKYADEHRNELKDKIDAMALKAKLEKDHIFDEFLKYATKKGVKTNWKDLKISREILETQTKAYIARNILGEEGFYPIIKDIDKTLNKAQEILKGE